MLRRMMVLLIKKRREEARRVWMKGIKADSRTGAWKAPQHKEGATDSRREAKRENPIKSGIPAAFETSERELDRTFRAILTRSTWKIFPARNLRRFVGVRLSRSDAERPAALGSEAKRNGDVRAQLLFD
jgi:hypothetical protein